MPSTTTLTQAVAMVEEFAAGWLDENETVNVLAEHWGIAPSTARALSLRLHLPARRRGAKKRRTPGVPLDSPGVLTDGRWVGRRGIVHWVRD